MQYRSELEHFDLGEFKKELFEKVASHATVDQQKNKIAKILHLVYSQRDSAQDVAPANAQ